MFTLNSVKTPRLPPPPTHTHRVRVTHHDEASRRLSLEFRRRMRARPSVSTQRVTGGPGVYVPAAA